MECIWCRGLSTLASTDWGSFLADALDKARWSSHVIPSVIRALWRFKQSRY